jgi:four helix bundle protein
VGDFRRLKVWDKAHRLTLDVYRAVAPFPREEMYGLTSQLKRSASSIPANIAEGCGRNRDSELARFLEIAMGSTSELDYHLLLARDLGFLPTDTHERLAIETKEVHTMLFALIPKLRSNSPKAHSS